MTRAEKVISALGYAGLTPFVAACGLLYAGEEARASQLFLSYSAIILSFLGGTHWGQTSLVWKDTRVGGRAIRTGGEQRICATRMVCAPVKPWQHPLPVYYSHYRLCAVVFGRSGVDADDRSCRASPLLGFSRFPNHRCAAASRGVFTLKRLET